MQLLRRGTCVPVSSRHCGRACIASVTVYVRNLKFPAIGPGTELLGKRSWLATVFGRTDIFSPHSSGSLGTNYKGREFYRSLAATLEQPPHSAPQCAV